MLNGNDLKKGIVVYDSLQHINNRTDVSYLIGNLNTVITTLAGPLDKRGLIIKSTLCNKKKEVLEETYYADEHTPGVWNCGIEGIYCQKKNSAFLTNITGESAILSLTQYELLSISGHNPFGNFSDLRPTVMIHIRDTKNGPGLFIYRDYHLHDMKGERKDIYKREYDRFIQSGNSFNKTKTPDVQIFQIKIADTTTMYPSLKECFKHSENIGERLLNGDLKRLLDWPGHEQQIEIEEDEIER